ncbi:MAG TPA: hypothetical protein VFS12_09595, partial [Terriglobia bacterium]|nr:hypothetical protein [Terriglobia bacterium]
NGRVKGYMDLQKRVSINVPPLAKAETDPAKIAIHTKALANGIQQARANAKPGDIFSPNVAQGVSASRSRRTARKGRSSLPGDCEDRKSDGGGRSCG